MSIVIVEILHKGIKIQDGVEERAKDLLPYQKAYDLVSVD